MEETKADSLDIDLSALVAEKPKKYIVTNRHFKTTIDVSVGGHNYLFPPGETEVTPHAPKKTGETAEYICELAKSNHGEFLSYRVE